MFAFPFTFLFSITDRGTGRFWREALKKQIVKISPIFFFPFFDSVSISSDMDGYLYLRDRACIYHSESSKKTNRIK